MTIDRTASARGTVPRAESPGPVVVATDVHRRFGDRHVLRGLDLTIHAGEFVAMLGRSGSGKSTFLRILADLDPDAEGSVLGPSRRAVVFQEPRLLPWRRVFDNVVLGSPGAPARDRARRLLDEVGLSGHLRAWPVTLSGGEAQRAALARALVREPDLLLLDEPFGALDALTRLKMHALLQQLFERYRPAVLFVTHDVDEAILLADRIVVLTEGEISLEIELSHDQVRHRSSATFEGLRQKLLRELGVSEATLGQHQAP